MKLFVCCCYRAGLPRLPRPVWGIIIDFVPHIFIYYPVFAAQHHTAEFVESVCALGEMDLLTNERPFLNTLFGIKHGTYEIYEKYRYFKCPALTKTEELIYTYIMGNYLNDNCEKTLDEPKFELTKKIIKMCKNPNINRLSIFLEKRKRDKYVVTMTFHMLVKFDQKEAVVKLHGSYGNKAITAACLLNKTDIIARIIMADNNIESCFRMALTGGHLELAKCLLEFCRVYPFTSSSNIQHWAAYNGWVHIIDFLDQWHIPFSVSGAAQGGQIELIKSRTGLTEEAKKLLFKFGYDLIKN